MAAQEWTLEGVLDELANIEKSMKDRSFVFILGAGASIKSGIPTGKDLAQRWLRDLHKRECLDEQELDAWLALDPLKIADLSYEGAAEFYSQIFDRRFSCDPEAGYAELENAMEGKVPSLGYSLLAEIIQHTRHKVVVTTNFDNLVAEALAMHAHQSPLVVAHETLAGFVRPQMRRPLVAKIHRDLFLKPMNDEKDVGRLKEEWQQALRKLFQHFTPIVIGYGGNDGSLMGFLHELKKGDLTGRMIWCYRHGSPPPTNASEVLEKHDGIKVKIAGFDEFMLQLASRLIDGFDLSEIAVRTEKLGRERAERYQQQAVELRENYTKDDSAKKLTSDLLSKSVRNNKSWRAWYMQAAAEADQQKSRAIYEDGIIQFPKSAELRRHYADLLASKFNDYDAAEASFKKALELDPSNADTLGKYAIFLSKKRDDQDSAETLFKKALELDPLHAGITGNYAAFLTNHRNDLDIAETLFKKALELDPSSVAAASNYALFLANHRNDIDAAEIFFKKALELNPSNPDTIVKYAALLLSKSNNNWDAAEELFEKALKLEPSNAAVISAYASFLVSHRNDPDAAEILFKRAIELDSSNVLIVGNYADFLANHRGDLNKAEVLYRKAITLDPTENNYHANFAALLLTRGTGNDIAQAKSLCEQTLAINSHKVIQPHAEALLYLSLIMELANEKPKAALAQLNLILQVDFRRGRWNFNPVFSNVFQKMDQAQIKFYRALGAAILDPELVSKLDEFEEWRILTPGNWEKAN